MKGKSRKRKAKKTPQTNVKSNAFTSPVNEVLNTAPSSDFAVLSHSSENASASTPKRSRRLIGQRQATYLTSAPVRSTSTNNLSSAPMSPPGPRQASFADSQGRKLRTSRKHKNDTDLQPTQDKHRHGKTRILERHSTQRSRPRFELKKSEAEEEDLLASSDLSIDLSPPVQQPLAVSIQGPEESEEENEEEEDLPSFLMLMDKDLLASSDLSIDLSPPVQQPLAVSIQGPEESEEENEEEEDLPSFLMLMDKDLLASSDLSIDLSPPEEEEDLPSFLMLMDKDFPEESEEENEEEEDLPSFLMLMDKKPPSITEGTFVWHKMRSYPFWPAFVKRVNHESKEACIIFIDDLMSHKKEGFSVALKTLKPFDCAESDELVCKAREKYDAAITWTMDLITDYIIRIACDSFSGSFVEYFAHDMSYPVRRKYPLAASERLSITSDSMVEESCDELNDTLSENHENVSTCSKRLLPDCSQAAHNCSTEKLVHFIVNQHMVEEHLRAVMRGQQHSTWLDSFLSTNDRRRRRVVDTYLEDEQLDEVYRYLNELYATEMTTAACLTKVTFMQRVPFVLDVLLPEAIIHAIAGVDDVSIKKAEDKYLKGREMSNRERRELDMMIERLIWQKSQHQNTTLALL